MPNAPGTGWKDRLKHAFAMRASEVDLSPEDRDLVRRVAAFLNRRGLTAPAIAALEVSRPYTFLGNQFLTFMKPFAHLALPKDDYDRFTRLMENRENVNVILDALEQEDAGE